MVKNHWFNIQVKTFQRYHLNVFRNSFKIGENRLSICEISEYTLFFATPAIDSCQFGGYMGLSGSGLECGYVPMSSEMLPKLHKQSPREQPEVDWSCSL